MKVRTKVGMTVAMVVLAIGTVAAPASAVSADTNTTETPVYLTTATVGAADDPAGPLDYVVIRQYPRKWYGWAACWAEVAAWKAQNVDAYCAVADDPDYIDLWVDLA
jgi:hypothetical protein